MDLNEKSPSFDFARSRKKDRCEKNRLPTNIGRKGVEPGRMNDDCARTYDSRFVIGVAIVFNDHQLFIRE